MGWARAWAWEWKGAAQKSEPDSRVGGWGFMQVRSGLRSVKMTAKSFLAGGWNEFIYCLHPQLDGRLTGFKHPKPIASLWRVECASTLHKTPGFRRPSVLQSFSSSSFFLLSFISPSAFLFSRWILHLLFFLRALFVRFSLCPFSFLRLCLCLPGVVPFTSYSLRVLVVLFNRVSPTYRPSFFFLSFLWRSDLA